MPKTVLATGTFDIVHKGHIHFLSQAKALGDELVVVVARDETVQKVKGKPPMNSESQRLKDVELIPAVDKAVLGNSGDKYAIIEKIKPNIIALGYDQIAFTEKLEKALQQRKINAEIIRLKPFKEQTKKSSILKTILPKN